jgi:hypothetical protein
MKTSRYDAAIAGFGRPHPAWCVIEEAHNAEDCSRQPSAQMLRNAARTKKKEDK